MGSPEKPLDVEMGDMSEEAKLNPADVDVKTEQGLLKGEEKEPRFTGLKKEELLEISSQPKWVRARWALFIIFWLVWFAMLIGAILIVVNAPRCKPEPKPEWYQDVVAYEAKVEEFADTFEGMKDRLPYVQSMNAEALLVTGAAAQNNPAAVKDNENVTFKSLVDAAHEKKMKIMVDVVVDSVSTDSAVFDRSASADCTGKTNADCGMLFWSSEVDSGVDPEWVFHATRNESYKIDPNSASRALVNYGNPNAMQYIMDVITAWFGRNIDGVQIRDIDKIDKAARSDFVDNIWTKFFVKNESDSVRALYVYSSKPDASLNPVQLRANQSNTEHAPVFFTADAASCTGSQSGKCVRDTVMKWRNQSRNIGGFVVSPLGEPLAAELLNNTKLAAAVNLLSMALPGVPILRSGDELAAASPVFTWDSQAFRESEPLNGSKAVLKETRVLTVRRVEGIQGMLSLRYDTRDADTKFDFLDTENDDVVAFRRQWDVKPPVLIVSNLSPEDHTVNVAVKNGLVKDDALAKEGAVLLSSTSKETGKEVSLEKLEIPSGTTLIVN